MEKQKKKQLIIYFSIMIVIAFLCLFANSLNRISMRFMLENTKLVTSNKNMLVHFISVGQGDAMAVNFPTGEVLLIDSGTQDHSVTLSTYIKDKVINRKRNKSIDFLFLTHADADHVGGTVRLINEFNIKHVILPIVDSESETYKAILNSVADDVAVRLASDTKIETKSGKVDILYPNSTKYTNESSGIVKITYNNKSFLFMADIPNYVEQDLVENHADFIDADVLKVAHHGSATSTTKEFVLNVSPQYAVISVGQNSYGHPTQSVINNLQSSGSEVLRTDIDGNIMFVVGSAYNLEYVSGEYVITSLSLDIRWLILVIELIISTKIVKILIKKEKKNSKNRKSVG